VNRAERRAYMKSIPKKVTAPQNRINQAFKVIDEQIKEFANNVIRDIGVKSDTLYFKSEIANFCYNIYFYESERRQTVGFSWPITKFLEVCSNKDRVELEMNMVIRKMIFKLQEINSTEVVWVE
jgi:hypothetical protein